MLHDDLETYLNTFAPFTANGKTFTLRKFFIPDTPDETITLISYAAGASIRAMGPSLGLPIRDKHLIEVTVRGPKKDHDTALDMAWFIHGKLDNFHGLLTGRQYDIEAMHPPILKEQDRNDRWKVEANYIAMKARG